MKKYFLLIILLSILFNKNVQAKDYVYYSTEKTVEHITYNKLVSNGEFVLTGYCRCAQCCGVNTGITASGKYVESNHTIAADISVLPFGTEVFIDGITYTVEDVGGAITNRRIDIYFDTHQEALDFGVQRKEIFIVEKEILEMVRVDFLEYMMITGDWIKSKIASSNYNEYTKEVTWTDKQGNLVAHRRQSETGFVNSVRKDLYEKWKNSR